MNGVLLFTHLAMFFFGFMVACLWGFHTYLALVNQTTWETVSWEKISYLKKWPKIYGSPFSKGVWSNLSTYCCHSPIQTHTNWTIPGKLPTSPKKQFICC